MEMRRKRVRILRKISFPEGCALYQRVVLAGSVPHLVWARKAHSSLMEMWVLPAVAVTLIRDRHSFHRDGVETRYAPSVVFCICPIRGCFPSGTM